MVQNFFPLQTHASQRRVLDITDISFDYRSKQATTSVLHRVSLSIDAGQWVAVMGPSGSGKSTLLLCAAGLLRAQQGTVTLAGIDLGKAPEKILTRMRRDRLGFIFQDFNLVPALTAEQNIGLPSRFGGTRRSRDELTAALDGVGLDGKATARPDQLSGGQRQRVAIARALITRPDVLFADEPTGSLDSHTGDQILDTLQAAVNAGTALLMVTHDPRVASRAHRVVWLRDGQVIDEVSGASPHDIASRLTMLEGEAR